MARKRTGNRGRVCIVTGKSHMYGNNVSHSKRRTRMRQSANIQKKSFWSDERSKWVPLTISARGIRIINKRGLEPVLKELEAQGYRF